MTYLFDISVDLYSTARTEARKEYKQKGERRKRQTKVQEIFERIHDQG